jgi:succinoglycan biosynthesis protein ExoL
MTRSSEILYLAPDLDDTAIARRTELLRLGGARVQLVGFRRKNGTMHEPAIVLGHTRNAAMLQRMWAVLKALPFLSRRLGLKEAPQIILARNLEMLALGVWLQLRYPGAILVFELLDIHRLMLGRGFTARCLRWVEAALLERVGLTIISSPGFQRSYLLPYARPINNLLLVENKPLARPRNPILNRFDPVTPGKITIGWFGNLRCSWSLATLDALTRAMPGRYDVILRGKPAYDAVPEFDSMVAANPDIRFLGAYNWPEDLAAIYAGVDLAWLIDRYDPGTNSDWLLPNRLYEGCLYGAVPIHLAGTETAARLSALGIGITVDLPDLKPVRQTLDELRPTSLASLRQAVAAIPASVWQADLAECREIVSRMVNAGPRTQFPRANADPLPETDS